MVCKLSGFLALMVLLIPSYTTAGSPSAHGTTPEGWSITLAGRVDPDAASVAAARMTGLGEAFVYVRDHRGECSWYSFALENPDSLYWPSRRILALTMLNGSTEVAREVYAVTPAPQARRIKLGDHGIALRNDEVQRQRFRKGNIASVIFAGFRFGIPPDSVVDVRVNDRGSAGQPAAQGSRRSP
jgi:hypothetical protein